MLRDLLKTPPDWVRKIVRWVLPAERLRHGLIRRLAAANVKVRPRDANDLDLQRALCEEFTEANQELAALIDRDLASWNVPQRSG
jgi:hypothetical protein